MDNTEICAALFEAFARGDEHTARSLCHPDLRAQQNNNPPMDLETLLALSRTVNTRVENFRYEEPRRSATKSGFVEEHRVRGRLADGTEIDLAVCVVADVRDGRVIDLREYLDLSALGPLLEATG